MSNSHFESMSIDVSKGFVYLEQRQWQTGLRFYYRLLRRPDITDHQRGECSMIVAVILSVCRPCFWRRLTRWRIMKIAEQGRNLLGYRWETCTVLANTAARLRLFELAGSYLSLAEILAEASPHREFCSRRLELFHAGNQVFLDHVDCVLERYGLLYIYDAVKISVLSPEYWRNDQGLVDQDGRASSETKRGYKKVSEIKRRTKR